MQGLTHIESHLLSLLRQELWGKHNCLPADNDVADIMECEAIAELAKKQAVEGIILTRLSEMAVRAGAGEDVVQRYAKNKWTIVMTNNHVNDVAAKVITTLEHAGIGYVLLKGPAVARHYPTPLLRKAGDIDIYVGKEGYHAAVEVLTPLIHGDVELEDKHAGMRIDGIEVELHHSVAAHRYTRDGKSVEQWAKKALHPETARQVCIGETDVNVPSAQAESIYVFYHLWHHLFHHSGVGLRQLSDWMMTLHDDHEAIDTCILEKTLQRFHLLTDWRIFGTLLVEHLGLPVEEFPLYRKGYEKRAERLLKIIMQCGNHGEQGYEELLQNRPQGKLSGRLYTMRKFLGLYKRLYRVSPRSARKSISLYIRNGFKSDN